MRNLIASAFILGSLVIACGDSKPANDPSSTNTTTNSTTPTTAPANGTGDPSNVAAGTSDKTCKTPETPAKPPADLTACKATCEKLDDKVPEGSRCIPPRTSCNVNCDQQFKK